MAGSAEKQLEQQKYQPARHNLVLSSPGEKLKLCFNRFWILMALLGVRGVLEMIVSHRTPSSLNMTPYRAIWTYFGQNSMSFIN